MADAVWKGKPRRLALIIRDLPLYLTGHKQDPTGVMERMRLRMARAALNVIYREYIVKSRGEMDAAGVDWPDLAQVTIRRRKQRQKAVKARAGSSFAEVEILIDTGRMLRSFSPDGSDDQIMELTSNGVKAGSSLEYAEKHQEGAENLPARPPIAEWDDWPQEWRDEVLKEMSWGCREFLLSMSHAGYAE